MISEDALWCEEMIIKIIDWNVIIELLVEGAEKILRASDNRSIYTDLKHW